MNKRYLLSFLLLGASCGNYENSKIDKVGELRSLTKSVETLLGLSRLKSVCLALAQKEAILPSSLNSRLTFVTEMKSCEGTHSPEERVEVNIQSGLNGYFFKRDGDGSDYIFPQIETASSGVLSHACEGLTSQNQSINPLKISSVDVLFVSTNVSSTDCP
jgi:hypothetical protein